MDVPADTIIDSIRVDYYGAEIFVTPDGTRLLVMRYDHENGHRMEIYNTTDLSYLQSYDLYGEYFFDGTDNYGVCMSSDSICFIDPNSLVIQGSAHHMPYPGYAAFLDTVTNTFFVKFHRDSDTASVIYWYDCNTEAFVDSLAFPLTRGSVTAIAYNWLTDDLYMTSKMKTGLAFFYQYDFALDSIISRFVLSEASGSIAVTPNGREIYMTDGGHGMFGYIPPRPIWIIDAFTHQPITWVPPYDTARVILPFFHNTYFTSDGKRAYIEANSSSGGGVPIVVIDTRTHELIKSISPYLAFTSDIVLGMVPES